MEVQIFSKVINVSCINIVSIDIPRQLILYHMEHISFPRHIQYIYIYKITQIHFVLETDN